MQKTSYQTPELRDENDVIIQQGAFGKNTALANATNDGWIDYVMNDLEALHDVVGASSPTLDANGHVVEPANLVADEHFDGDETESLLMQAVSTLPPKQRQVFCMKYFEEQKYEDISELVGTSVGALKASYHIAVEKITSFIKSKE